MVKKRPKTLEQATDLDEHERLLAKSEYVCVMSPQGHYNEVLLEMLPQLLLRGWKIIGLRSTKNVLEK